jgi:hypothetical protein
MPSLPSCAEAEAALKFQLRGGLVTLLLLLKAGLLTGEVFDTGQTAS